MRDTTQTLMFCVPDMQPDNTTKEWVRDLRRRLYVSILVAFQASRLYKSVLVQKPGQGQRGLATGDSPASSIGPSGRLRGRDSSGA
ncbi:hypothetical protein ROHU_027909 [Labeo rohita]|uniref:Uncharacterized protein n=1 Tax=Labeo rohita TaxID=84645 RepID=A0A498MFG5_LABRO|nr:hypothetical protein ROHU_027909 [Labeo rohita]